MFIPVLSLRLPTATALMLSVMSQMLWWSTPAESQGFFQQLLGLSQPPQVRTAPVSLPLRAPVAGAPMRFERQPAPPRWSSGQHVAREGSGSFTTVCVRMCDGFYFPISQRVPRSRFHNDADACRSRCGQSESRLFYHSFGADMKSAVDLTGRAYAALPIAFLHRKRLVAGCACRPEPWSEAALIRHEGYAIAEGHDVPGRSRGIGSLAVVAGNYAAGAPLIEPPSTRDTHGTFETTAPAEPSGETDSGQTDVNGASAGSQMSASAEAEASARNSPQSRTGQRRFKPVAVASRAPAPKQQPVRAAVPKKAPVHMASASGSSKLVWPGDVPTRTR